MVYVDDVLISAPTKWVEAVMEAYRNNWECKIIGIIVKDQEISEKSVDTVVFLSITIDPVENG